MFENIEELIEVKRPYYSLDDIKCDANGVSALVKSEHPMENEIGGIAAAEVGRHLAILGSCALATTNPDKSKHYYLAHRASLRRIAYPESIVESNYKVDSRTMYLDKRKGVAHSRLYMDDIHIFDLEVQYHVIKERIFNKLYKEKYVEYDPSVNNPYAEEYELVNLGYKENELTAMLAPLSPQQCSGHFETHPCLPVAVLMHALSRSAGRLLSKQLGHNITYIVDSADICAENLAFYGDSVCVKVKFIEEIDGAYFYSCEANDGDNRIFGHMDIKLVANIA